MAYTSSDPWDAKTSRPQRRKPYSLRAPTARLQHQNRSYNRPALDSRNSAAPSLPQVFMISCQNPEGQAFTFDHTAHSELGIEKICARFARGTLIKTQSGTTAVEDLRPGDLVLTKDNGAQPLRWISACTLKNVPAMANHKPTALRIKGDALGIMRPDQDLVVTPLFRLLVNHPANTDLFGSPETLAPAMSLLDGDLILNVQTSQEMVFYNLMFDAHQIIFANGLETESYHPGNNQIAAMSYEMQSHMLALFPHLSGDLMNFGRTARPVLKGFEAEVLRDF